MQDQELLVSFRNSSAPSLFNVVIAIGGRDKHRNYLLQGKSTKNCLLFDFIMQIKWYR